MRTEILAVATLAALVPSSARAQCPVPGFDVAAFGDVSVSVGNGNTDSYNSSLGSYATTKCSSAPPCVGGVATNGTASGAISLGPNGDIAGTCQIGAGSSVANITPNSSNCDSKSVALGPKTLTAPTLPSSLTGTYGAISNDLTIPGPGNYSMTSLSLSGNKALTVSSGPVVIFLTGSGSVLSLSGNGAINNNTQIPSNLIFMCTSSAAQSISVVGNGNAYFGIYCPKADITITGNGTIYGAIVGKSVSFSGNNGYVHYDQALASFTSSAITCGERSRATPIVTQIGNDTAIVQGTYEGAGTKKTISSTADVASFEFPYIKGHMRARTTSSITVSGSTFSSGTVLFDAGATGKIPTANNTGCNSFDGSCRNLFTVTQTPDANGVSFHPAHVQFKDGNASTIGALIAPTSAVSGIGASHWQTIVRTVLAGSLGGVDRSAVAVIPASPIAGVSTRPTIAYFGATDGMLHAVCASVGGSTETGTNVCPSLGTELWAFMPRTQLPLVRKNMTRIDGSVRVVDAFGDFVNNPATGTKSFRTILTFQTGYADASIGASPAIYSLDVTDPANPVVLWEYVAPGVGLATASFRSLVNGAPKNLVVAQTNDGTGFTATAISLETGAKQWSFSYAYPSPPRGSSADMPLPLTGVPGGAVGVDLTGNGLVTDVVMADLYGNLWRLDAATGASKTGATTPLFQFSTNKHPIGALPAIYSDGSRQYAVFGSGGYTDPTSATWTAGTQSLISIDLAASGPYPIDETSNKLAFKQDLTAGDKVFAQVLVVGEEVFVTADSTDVNQSTFGTGGTSTGRAFGYNISTSQATTTVVVRGGASSLANVNTTLYSSSSDQQQELSTDAVGTTGTSVDSSVLPKLVRKLWLRVQ